MSDLELQLLIADKSTEELLEEAIDNLTDTIEYVLSESGDPNLPRWLEEVEETLKIVLDRIQKEST